ncbi:MAG: DUF3656 domain-containing U32 family peptidase [Spirochaetota bacterium]
MKSDTQKRVELLAPAGSPEALIAAIDAGADAVYLGLQNFNARKRAKNFTEQEFTLAINYAHHHHAKVYLTLNTLIFDNEIESIIDILNLAVDSRVDAIIVHDLGLITLIKEFYPQLAIHASTQTFCHNSLHAKVLKNLGVSRIILPRELTLKEIQSIVQKIPLEYEVFIHGALCFSFSGCCLFSSYLFQDSGNRGRCRQPCRYPFKVLGNTVYPFSMRDLSLGKSFKDLITVGVTSFKIEGRLKSTWYVKSVVQYYRKLIDSCSSMHETTLPEPEFRRSCKGYLYGYSYHALVDTHNSGTAGNYVGKVIAIKNKSCTFSTYQPIQKGARLRLVNDTGKKIFEGTLLHYHYNKNNQTIEWFITISSHLPLYVYQIGESKTFDTQKFLKSVPFTPSIVDVTITIANNVTIDAAIQNFTKTYKFPIAVDKAKNQAVTVDTVTKVFKQTGNTPFVAHITCHSNNSNFIPLSLLKEVRRQFYCKLLEDYRTYTHIQNLNTKIKILKHLSTLTKRFNKTTITCGDSSYKRIHIEKLHSVPFNNNYFIELPLFVSETALSHTMQEIDTLIKQGYDKFIVPTYGWVEYFKEKNVLLCAGEIFYCVNTFSYEVVKRFGIPYFVISPDMNHKTIHMKEYEGYLPLPQNKIYLATRLHIPKEMYQYKNKKFCVEHFKEYAILTDCHISTL